MNITIHASFLPHNDPDASLAFYRNTLGFEVRGDVWYGGMRWLTVGPADQSSRFSYFRSESQAKRPLLPKERKA